MSAKNFLKAESRRDGILQCEAFVLQRYPESPPPSALIEENNRAIFFLSPEVPLFHVEYVFLFNIRSMS